MSGAAREVGILGGGQLARMLTEAGLRLGLTPWVLERSASGLDAPPAVQVGARLIRGELTDEKCVHELFSKARTVILENEFVDCVLIARALKANRGSALVPGVQAIALLQDKLQQKEVLESLRIASAPFEAMPAERELQEEWVERMMDAWPEGAVFKWARLGYDGKGVLITPPPTKRSRAALKACIMEFLAKARSTVFAERRVRFRRELAIVSCHSIRGEFATWPLVVSQQENGICRLVTGPAAALGVPRKLEAQAVEAAHRLARALPLHGCFAIEFFEDENGALLVNEIAPRVHNSGHYTQDASATSQFENHWRAVLGMKLGATDCGPAFAMLNVLGPKAPKAVPMSALPEPGPRSHLHWYGKAEATPWRKLGHLNGSVSSVKELPGLVKELEKSARRWENQRS